MSTQAAVHRPPPGNSGAIGDLSLLRDRMRLLARWHSAACSWRVPEEAADQTYDEVVDRLLREDLPVDLEAWARSALIKLLYRGPKRCEPGRRMRSLDGFAEPPRCESVVDWRVRIRPEERQEFTRMTALFRSLRSPRQAEVFDRLGACDSVYALAASVGMADRDCLRILTRIEEKCGKISANLHDSCHPPAPCT